MNGALRQASEYSWQIALTSSIPDIGVRQEAIYQTFKTLGQYIPGNLEGLDSCMTW